MATVLEKDLVRESTVKLGEREIIVTLTKDQKIKLKEKGLRGGDVSIPILDLFKQLKGMVVEDDKPKESISISRETKTTPTTKTSKAEKKRLLQELRSHNAISTASVEIMSQMDAIINSLLKHGD